MMEDLLKKLRDDTIPKGLPYLFAVEVIDDENLPPDLASYPCVGLMDGATIHASRPGQKDKDTLTVRAIAYQEIFEDKPGQAIMGSAEQLGDQGKGVLAIAKDLRALLNDNFLGLGFQYAHLDREDPSIGLARADGRMIAAKSLFFTYLKFVDAAPFSPSNLPGLVLWLKADAIAGLADGDAVTTWEDSSSQANNVTQASAANKPLYRTNVLNGKPVVRFDGTNDTLESATFAPTPSAYTYFLVLIDPVSTGSPRALINGRFDGVFNGFRYGVSAAGDRFLDHPGIASALDIGGRTANWEIVSATRAATAPLLSAWINGAPRTITNSTMAYNAPDARLYVGGTTNLGEKPWEGDIAEIIIYNSALSTANRQAVESYLKSKYAL